jgi:hypothetical protein
MEIRFFQVVVPLVALLFMANQGLRYRRGRLNLGEALFSGLLWIGVALLAVFPDEISNFVAALFGFKSNTNAVLFLGLGILFYFQYRIYRLQVAQRRAITELNRQLALDRYEKAQGPS